MSFRLGQSWRPGSIGPRAALVLAAVGVLASTGCVERRMMIRSNPDGAMVYIDDYPIGTTPIAHNFTYYGTRKIRLEKDGYETLTVYQHISTPWYEIPPLDFVSENFVPGTLRDRRMATYQLAPQRQVPPNELYGRAQDLRARSAAPAPVAPPGAVLPPSSPPVAPPGTVLPPSSAPPTMGGMPTYPLPPGGQ